MSKSSLNTNVDVFHILYTFQDEVFWFVTPCKMQFDTNVSEDLSKPYIAECW